MNLKKTANIKRTNPPRMADYTNKFTKDWQRLNRSGRYDMKHLKQVMMQLIANDEPLSAEYLEHSLTGDWKGFKECHIGGDFLLIYAIDDKINMIEFVRAGTHAELFN